MSLLWKEAPLAQAITDKQLYTLLYKELRESVNEALWGNIHPLHRTIAAWRNNIAILPEETGNKLLQKIEHAVGIW